MHLAHMPLCRDAQCQRGQIAVGSGKRSPPEAPADFKDGASLGLFDGVYDGCAQKLDRRLETPVEEFRSQCQTIDDRLFENVVNTEVLGFFLFFFRADLLVLHPR